MKLLSIIILLVLTACDRPTETIIVKRVAKSGKMIGISKTSDTLVLGDTLDFRILLPNPIVLDDTSIINIKSVIGSSCGYLVKRYNIEFDNTFGFADGFLHKENNAINTNGRYYLNPKLVDVLNGKVSYVPQDTGTYVLYTERWQTITCTTAESEGNVIIDLIPEYIVPSNHEYLLDSFPTAKIGYESGKQNDASPYYCFYVKHK